jgi:hypothetical protein
MIWVIGETQRSNYEAAHLLSAYSIYSIVLKDKRMHVFCQ